MTIGPKKITVEIESCQGCPALETMTSGMATYAFCTEKDGMVITAWLEPATTSPTWWRARKTEG